MEKEHKTIITEGLKCFLKERERSFEYDFIYKANNAIISDLININKEKIKIYDITKANPKTKKISIKNHINKTGFNPLVGNQQTFKIDFLDITTIYFCKSKKGKTTTSLGKKYFKNKDEEKTPSTYLANIAIICKALKFQQIEAFLINTQYQH